MTFEAFFLETENGARFCVHHPAAEGKRGAVLYVHPFAEELNRARRMAALAARAFARSGFASLAIDLEGCGDSSGDFGSATLGGWENDVRAGLAWLRARSGGPLWLWTLRAGSLLAGGAASGGAVDGVLMVQPVLSGDQALRQFLRLKAGADLGGARENGGVEGLRRELERGNAVEVAGYTLGPVLARDLTAARCDFSAGNLRIECIEAGAGPAPAVSPALDSRAEEWRARGHTVHCVAVAAPPFWQTTESVVDAALIERLVATVGAS